MKQAKVSEDELRYVTTGVVTDETQRAFTDIYWRKSTYLKVLSTLIAVLALGSAWYVTHGEWFYLIVNIALIVALIAAFNVSRRRAVRVYDLQHNSRYVSDAAEYMTGYGDTFVYTENRQQNTSAQVPYEEIQCAYRTDKYLFLLTKQSTFTETFLDRLSKEDQEGLLSFLKEKGIKKKW